MCVSPTHTHSIPLPVSTAILFRNVTFLFVFKILGSHETIQRNYTSPNYFHKYILLGSHVFKNIEVLQQFSTPLPFLTRQFFTLFGTHYGLLWLVNTVQWKTVIMTSQRNAYCHMGNQYKCEKCIVQFVPPSEHLEVAFFTKCGM